MDEASPVPDWDKTLCDLLAASPEFAAARVVMLFMSTPTEIDTSPLALKSWQAGKTVVVPKVVAPTGAG